MPLPPGAGALWGATAGRLPACTAGGRSRAVRRADGLRAGARRLGRRAGLDVLVHPPEDLAQRRPQPTALSLQMTVHGLDLVGETSPGLLQPGDLLTKPLLGLRGHLAGLGLGLLGDQARLGLGVGHDRGTPGPRSPPWSRPRTSGPAAGCVGGCRRARRRPTRGAGSGCCSSWVSSWEMRSAAWRSRSPLWRSCSCNPSASTAAFSRYSSTSSRWYPLRVSRNSTVRSESRADCEASIAVMLAAQPSRSTEFLQKSSALNPSGRRG